VFCVATVATTDLLARGATPVVNFRALRVDPDQVDEMRRRSDAALKARESLVEFVAAFHRRAESKGLTLAQARRRAEVDPGIVAAVRADIRAQAARDAASRRTWTLAVGRPGAGAHLLAQEPMWLAAESLDFHLRRRLGPTLSTEIEALRPYSRRDVVQ
jgi:hypothetical protein